MLQRCITAWECDCCEINRRRSEAWGSEAWKVKRAVLRVGMYVVELNVNVHVQRVSSENTGVQSAHHSMENGEEKTHELIK